MDTGSLPSYWVHEAVFELVDGEPVCRLRTGACVVELRAKPETMFAAFESFGQMVLAFRNRQSAEIVRLDVVPAIPPEDQGRVA